MRPRLQGQNAARRWPRFERVRRQAGLFREMMERAHIDPGAAIRDDFAEAVQRCLTCPDACACRNWLDNDASGLAPEFCRNAAYLLRVRKGAGSRRENPGGTDT